MIASHINRLIRFFAILLLALITVVAVCALIIQFYIFPNINQYKNYITDKISEKTELNAEIGNIKVGWDNFRPHLTLSHITLRNTKQDPVLQLRDTKAHISWLSIPQGSPVLSQLTLEQPNLTIERLKSGEIFVAGISTKGSGEPTLANWLIKQHNINIENATIHWFDNKRNAPPLTLTNLNFNFEKPRILGLLNQHQFNASFIPSKGTKHAITVDGKLFGNNFNQLEDWRGTVSATINKADFTAFRDWFDYPTALNNVQGDAKLTLRIDAFKPQSVDADFDLHHVRFALPQSTKPISIAHLKGKAGWQQYHKKQLVNFDNITLKTGNIALKKLNAHYQLTQETVDQHKIAFDLPSLDLQTLQSLVTMLPPEHKITQYLTRLSPDGMLEKLSFSWEGNPNKTKHFSFETDFKKLSINAYEHIPGFDGSSGHFQTTDTAGAFTLTSKKMTLDLQKILRQPIRDNQIVAKVNWKFLDDETRIKVESLSINNPDVSGRLVGNITLNPDAPYIDLEGDFKQFEMRAVKYYLPKFLRDGTLRWLDNAFLAGTGHDVRMELKGPIKAFPFVNAQQQYDSKIGVFKITSHVKDATLHYGKNWPDITNIVLDATFEGPGLTLKNSTGTIDNNPIIHADLEIPTLHTQDPHLLIKGQVVGKISQAIHFVNNSPVKRVTQGFTDDLQTTGNGQLDLSLDIPLKRADDTAINGYYQVNDGVLRNENIPTLRKINGKLHFTETILEADAVSAIAYNKPIALDIKTGENKAVYVNATGKMDSQLLNNFVKNTDYYISGQSDFAAKITIQKPNVEIKITSDLSGIVSHLPAPLNKTANASTPVSIVKTESPQHTKLAFSVDTILAGNIAYQSNNNAIEQLNIAVAEQTQSASLNGKLAAMPSTGININADLNYVNADVWQTVYQHLIASEDSSEIKGAKNYHLTANNVDVFGRRFNQVTVNQANDPSAIFVSSNTFSGNLKWDPAGQGKLIARLSHLQIPEAAPEVTYNNPLLPQNVSPSINETKAYPAIDIQTGQFSLDDIQLGGLELIAKPQGDNWSIDRFVLYAKDSELSGNGLWKNAESAQKTDIQFDWKVKNLGQTLTRFGYAEAISKGKGHIKGNLAWPSSPHKFDVKDLSGDLKFEVKSGEILKVKPGVGRLLGLVSLQSLPRRLTLDFRDLFSQGFAFDKISADLKVTNGIMQSDNFQMIGPAADVKIKGSTNLKTETQNLTVHVLPQISDSLSLAALAGGPLAGAVAFLAQKVLKDPLNKIVSSEYQIIGTWDNPEEVKKEKPQPQQPTIQ